MMALPLNQILQNPLSSLPKGISDRTITLMLDLEDNTHAAFVSCHAPTMTASEQKKDDFYDCFRDVISGVKHKDKLILMGDFSARVGADHVTWEGVSGHLSVGRMNSNGLRLLSICSDFNLTITNILFQ